MGGVGFFTSYDGMGYDTKCALAMSIYIYDERDYEQIARGKKT
jgi:hypothetical protein